MLIQKIFEVSLCVLSVYILYYWIIIIMGKSKHERSKTNMLCSLKTVVVLIPTSHNGQLYTTVIFFCPQGGCYGKVWPQ